MQRLVVKVLARSWGDVLYRILYFLQTLAGKEAD